MEVFPDPKLVSTSEAFRWFQKNVPGGYRCKDANLTSCDDVNIYWTVTYILQSKEEKSCLQMRADISRWLGNRAKLTTVLMLRTRTDQLKCMVGFKPRVDKQRNALWQYILPSLTRKDHKTDKGEKSRGKTSVDLTKHRACDCKILDVNGEIRGIDENVIPKKLLFDGKNITRKVFSVSRMNRHFLSLLIKNKNRPLIRTKMEHREVKFHTASPIANKGEISKPSGERKSSVVTDSTLISNRVMIPCDYGRIERSYQLSKLKNTNVFICVQKYLALKCYQRGSEPIRSSFNRVAAANEISANGLPVDESLVSLFQQYCTEAGINSDDVDREASRIRSLA